MLLILGKHQLTDLLFWSSRIQRYCVLEWVKPLNAEVAK
jgi:hypothetical protein